MNLKRPKRYEKIIEALRRRVEESPQYPDLRHQLALALFVQGDREAAERELLEALRLNPKYQEAALHLGCLYIEEGRWEEARSILRKIGRTKSKDPIVQQICHQIALGGKSQPKIAPVPLLRKESKSRFEKPHLRRLRGQFHYLAGILLAREGRLAQAIEELGRAAQWIPSSFQFYYHRGLIFYHCGDSRRAIAQFKKALDLDPQHGMAHAHLSFLYGLRGRISEAIRHMEKAVALHPGYADLHYHLALLYSSRRRHPEAIAQLKRALRLNPNYLFARINLGVLYEEMGRWREARREYERVLKLTPEDEHVRRRLERIQRKGR